MVGNKNTFRAKSFARKTFGANPPFHLRSFASRNFLSEPKASEAKYLKILSFQSVPDMPFSQHNKFL